VGEREEKVDCGKAEPGKLDGPAGSGKKRTGRIKRKGGRKERWAELGTAGRAR
jgi:hypothetical protein